MKLYKKNDLIFNDGMLVAEDGEVICAPAEIVVLANELETRVQKAACDKENPVEPVGEPKKFQRKSIDDWLSVEKFECETPLLDKKVEESIALMDEIDDAALCGKMNEALDEFRSLMKWADEDFVAHIGPRSLRFDTPVMGNPLKWTAEKIQDFIAMSFGCEIGEAEEK